MCLCITLYSIHLRIIENIRKFPQAHFAVSIQDGLHKRIPRISSENVSWVSSHHVIVVAMNDLSASINICKSITVLVLLTTNEVQFWNWREHVILHLVRRRALLKCIFRKIFAPIEGRRRWGVLTLSLIWLGRKR